MKKFFKWTFSIILLFMVASCTALCVADFGESKGPLNYSNTPIKTK